MSDVIISRIIGTIKNKMDEHAHGAMQMTPRDIVQYGEIVGAYRGLQEALNLIEGVLCESEAEEVRQL